MSPARHEAHRVVQDSQGWAGRAHAPAVIADCPIATRAHVKMLLHESEHHWTDTKQPLEQGDDVDYIDVVARSASQVGPERRSSKP